VIPPIPYFGGKQRIADHIVHVFPEHEGYVEPFAGSLAVLLSKPAEKVEVANDLNGRLMSFWRVLRDQAEQLERVCELTPHSREEYLAALSQADDPLEDARRVFVLYTQAFAADPAKGWRVASPVSNQSTAMKIAVFHPRIGEVAKRLRGVTLESRPWQDVVRPRLSNPKMLMYVDPPYLSETRMTGHRAGYTHEMDTPEEHAELLEALMRARGAVVLSAYESPLYDDLLSGWEKVFIGARTHNGARREVLYLNYPPSPMLF
jgi:DNA adenine methylase